MPLTIIIYGEFTSLLVDRSYGLGVSSNTTLLTLFGGGKVLWVFFFWKISGICV